MGKENTTENENQSVNTATEVLHELKRQSIGRTIISGISILALSGLLMYQININYQNDREWRELFSSYDYVSQDGQGYNYYNSRVVGEVNNGTEGEK